MKETTQSHFYGDEDNRTKAQRKAYSKIGLKWPKPRKRKGGLDLE